ncbi:MAG: glycosyltransferase [bacterium]|nr:glycosyltransferase [bacterium]
MKKIRVCFILGTLDVGGTEKQVLLLCKYFNREKFHPFIISLRNGIMKEDFIKENVPVFVIGKRYRFDFVALFKLILTLMRIRPDILHTFMFTSNTWGRIAGIASGIPVIVASERSVDLWKKRYHFFIDKLLGFFTDKIVCNSNSVKELYKKNLGTISRKLIVIKNGIEFEKFKPVNSKQKQGNKKIVFTASRLSPEKGIQFLIDAARIVLKERDDVRFLIAGEGKCRKEFEDIVTEYGIQKNVVFLGYRKDIPDLILQSDIVVLPSLWEGLPNIILEAMAMKKPVVATSIGGTIEIVKDGETGFLVSPGDINQLAERIQLLISDENLTKKFGENGYKFVRKHFDVYSMVSSYENLYMMLLDRRN